MAPVYDSQRGRVAAYAMPRVLLAHRRLLALLVRRDLVARYKRSALGLSWTLVNPLLEMAVLYLVFSHLFRFSTRNAPYVVYLLSGLLLVTLFRQAVIGVASSLVNNGPTLSRIYVPLEVFSTAAAVVILVNFTFGLIPLAVIMLLTGTSISPTILLIGLTVVPLLGLATGIGLMLAPAAVRYPDVLDLSQVALTLIGYLAPVFYPFRIVPAQFRLIERLNPLYHFLRTFRSLLYEDSLGSGISYLVIYGSAGVALAVGAVVMTRYGRRAIAAL